MYTRSIHEVYFWFSRYLSFIHVLWHQKKKRNGRTQGGPRPYREVHEGGIQGIQEAGPKDRDPRRLWVNS